VSIDDLLKATFRLIRNSTPHVALLGFPVPQNVGEESYQMHWLALQLPILSSGTRTARGFRTNEMGYWQRDRTELLHTTTKIDWLMTENWHPAQIGTRGKLSNALVAKNILLIGAGALGSMVAEQLVRAGVRQLTIIDGDRLEAGNIVRHTLSLANLKQNKASALAAHLSLASPHVSIEAITSSFPSLSVSEQTQVQQCDVILDCTGQDDVLASLEQFPWQESKCFVSLSLGLGGRRLFCFSAWGDTFPHSAFREQLHPWLESELQEYAGQHLPREGIGCWHPVFPARIDDIELMASTGLKCLEACIANYSSKASLTVFEQQYENGMFLGLSRVDSKVTHDLQRVLV